MSDSLDKLRASGSASAEHSSDPDGAEPRKGKAGRGKGEANTAKPDPVLVLYQGSTGPELSFKHVGALAVFKQGAGAPLTLGPGLNVVDGALFDAYRDYGPVLSRIDRDEIHPDVDISKFDGRRLRDIAMITTSVDAMEVIVELEKAKPQSGGGRHNRRDPELIAILESRIAARVRSRSMDLGSISV